MFIYHDVAVERTELNLSLPALNNATGGSLHRTHRTPPTRMRPRHLGGLACTPPAHREKAKYARCPLSAPTMLAGLAALGRVSGRRGAPSRIERGRMSTKPTDCPALVFGSSLRGLRRCSSHSCSGGMRRGPHWWRIAVSLKFLRTCSSESRAEAADTLTGLPARTAGATRTPLT